MIKIAFMTMRGFTKNIFRLGELGGHHLTKTGCITRSAGT